MNIIVAIDGFSGTGKSSTAKKVANALEYSYIDSGAMYRCITKYILDHHIDYKNAKILDQALEQITIQFRFNSTKRTSEVYLNGLEVETAIRTQTINEKVSEIAAITAVRTKMVAQQRAFGQEKGIVMDGRDIGSVVFPLAELKIFMTTDIGVRAQRRYKEMLENGLKANLQKITANLAERDHLDSTRADSPLIKAADAIEMDTTKLSFEEQVQNIVNLAKQRMHES